VARRVEEESTLAAGGSLLLGRAGGREEDFWRGGCWEMARAGTEGMIWLAKGREGEARAVE